MIHSAMLVFTGAMGAGKSTVLAELRKRGVACVAEPARAILAEQRGIGGAGVPETDPDLFCKLMLSRSIHDYESHRERCFSSGITVKNAKELPIIFDRGVPDMQAYARLFGLAETVYQKACAVYRYESPVFYFPAWEAIYTTDSERKMSFGQAAVFGDMVAGVYRAAGNELVEVPKVPLRERVSFILNKLQNL